MASNSLLVILGALLCLGIAWTAEGIHCLSCFSWNTLTPDQICGGADVPSRECKFGRKGFCYTHILKNRTGLADEWRMCKSHDSEDDGDFEGKEGCKMTVYNNFEEIECWCNTDNCNGKTWEETHLLAKLVK